MPETCQEISGKMAPKLVVPASAKGPILVCEAGLSFWGGVDPRNGEIIDAYHPQHGKTLAGRVVLMPSSRGSCSGSGVLLELAMNGHAPQALIFREPEDILTLGALVATQMFDCPLAVIRLPTEAYDMLATKDVAEIADDRLLSDGVSLKLEPADAGKLKLSARDLAMLDGRGGIATKLAMEILCAMAVSQGAEELVDVTRGHIDGCILHSPANLVFAEKVASLGAKVAIPTTINAISVDLDNWQTQNVPPDFGVPASRLANAYVEMGAEPTFTCAPY